MLCPAGSACVHPPLRVLCHCVSNGTFGFYDDIVNAFFWGLISIAYWGPRFRIFICSFVSCFLVRFIIRGCPVVGVSCCSLVPRFSSLYEDLAIVVAVKQTDTT